MDSFRQQPLSLLGPAPAARLAARGDKRIRSSHMHFCVAPGGTVATWGSRQRSALLPDMGCAFSNSKLLRLNSFNYKLKELIQEEGRGGGKAQSCQALSLDVSKNLNYFI